MNKYYGSVGYVSYEETGLDVWEEVTTVRKYGGDVLKSSRRFTGSEHLNDNVVLNNRISIIADPYAFKHYGDIKWCEWMGTKWEVTNTTIEYPRLILDLGGVYNEQTRT